MTKSKTNNGIERHLPPELLAALTAFVPARPSEFASLQFDGGSILTRPKNYSSAALALQSSEQKVREHYVRQAPRAHGAGESDRA